MKEVKRIRYLIYVVILVIIGIGIKAAIDFRADIPRDSFADDVVSQYRCQRSDPFPDYGGANEELISNDYEQAKTTAEELYAESNVILRVTPTGVQELYKGAVLSEMEVLEVLKQDDHRQTEEKILVYEPLSVLTQIQSIMFMTSANIMQVGREYIVCLDFFEKPEGYNYKNVEERTYVLANQFFGKFPAADPTYTYMEYDSEDDRSYGELKPYDYLFGEEAEMEQDLSLRRAFLSLLAERR